MRTQNAACSKTGRRHHNEDACHVEPGCGLFIVADGMGGHDAGEVASSMTTETIRDFFIEHLDDAAITWPWGADAGMTLTENKVCVAVRLAHRTVLDHARTLRGSMGTTVVVMVVRPDQIVIGHLGDSRAYRLRDGQLEQLTMDHSLYNQFVQHGIDPGAREDFPHKHVIVRAVGIEQGEDRPELTLLEPRVGDTFLLSTDGLHEFVGAQKMIELMSREDLDAACEELVERAILNGSTDNSTAVLCRIIG